MFVKQRYLTQCSEQNHLSPITKASSEVLTGLGCTSTTLDTVVLPVRLRSDLERIVRYLPRAVPTSETDAVYIATLKEANGFCPTLNRKISKKKVFVLATSSADRSSLRRRHRKFCARR